MYMQRTRLVWRTQTWCASNNYWSRCLLEVWDSTVTASWSMELAGTMKQRSSSALNCSLQSVCHLSHGPSYRPNLPCQSFYSLMDWPEWPWSPQILRQICHCYYTELGRYRPTSNSIWAYIGRLMPMRIVTWPVADGYKITTHLKSQTHSFLLTIQPLSGYIDD